MLLQKKFVKETILFVAVIILLFSFLVWYGNWNLELLFNEKVIDLEGDMTTSDEHLTIKPREMIIDHSKITILVDYQVNPELRQLDLEFTTPPRLLLEKENKVDNNNSTLTMPSGAYPDSSEKIETIDESYFKYEYWYQNFPYELEQDLTLILDRTYMSKDHSQEISVDPGDNVEVEISDIGKYKGKLKEPQKTDEGLDTITFEGEILSDQFEYGFRVRDYLISMVNGEEVRPTGAGGGGSPGSNSNYQFEREYRIEDKMFWEGDLVLQVGRIRVLIGNRFESPYMDLNITEEL
ncbi:hypothetical protein [Natranaerobius thermophilus]|uniref:Uncharacterized protein n=1 Tax=Natranaerobius thermophilus (strain ATCC BAA-1301 / DSM 18059 / JW/NM-WN-LF) TaxID=457570 RepID=B2A4U9_NATTJ|nr:hypothetical protein [Natranaerobius thermophilus]ACB83871.1 hypothetical protein Nther_0273 [Natranaerobius thermophilus JW/NM-WN-LF]